MGVFVEIFRYLATVLNTVMFLSPIPTMRDIHRTKSTGHMPFVPLACMVSNAHVWMVYGYLSADYVALFGTCAFGVLAALVYVAIYYRYTAEKSYAHKVLAVFGSVILFNSLYSILGANGYTNQSYDDVRKIIGYIATTSSIVMYTSPLEKIRLVFKHRSAVFIPIQIVSVGAANSASWVMYTILDKDWIVFVPNVFLLVIGLVQVALYWVFHPSKHPFTDESFVDDLELAIAKEDAGGHRSSTLTLDDTKEATPGFVALRSPLAPLQQA